MGSTGSGSQQQTQTQKSKTEPWKPTVGPLKDLVGQIKPQINNTALTGNETAALDQLTANAQQGNQYAPQINQLATDLFTGGIDRTGMAQSAYDDYKAQAQSYLSPDYLDPYKNPALQSYLQTTQNDISNQVNGMFAAAGRDFSGANLNSLARGITEGTAPIFANQYNQNVATQTGMMGNLYNAGNQTAGLLSGLDQTALGNRQTGIAAAQSGIDANNYGANAMLDVEAKRRGIPLQNLGNVSNLLLPIAGAGQQSSGTSTSQGTYTQPLSQTAMQWANVGSNLYKPASGASGAVPGVLGAAQQIGGMFSDRRLKEDIQKVGKLDNGLFVYSYRYKAGGPVHIGLMADEVEAVAPEAVGSIGGYKTVRYDLAVRA